MSRKNDKEESAPAWSLEVGGIALLPLLLIVGFPANAATI